MIGRAAAGVGALVAALAGAALLLDRADGPVLVFAGGPLRSGETVDLARLDWESLDGLRELELELVGAGRSRTLWFSVHAGAAYVACDLDCSGGLLSRWPEQVEGDDRVVIRIDGRRVEARLVHVPHGSDEYRAARAERERKYAAQAGARAAAEKAAHDLVVGAGEVLTGRARRPEPGDRLYRVAARAGP